jgi:hypothetical protein
MITTSLCRAAIAALALLTMPMALAQTETPNILVIMGDDIGQQGPVPVGTDLSRGSET